MMHGNLGFGYTNIHLLRENIYLTNRFDNPIYNIIIFPLTA